MQRYFLHPLDKDRDTYYLVYGKGGERNCMCPFINEGTCSSRCSLFEIKKNDENNYVVVLYCGTKREIVNVRLKNEIGEGQFSGSSDIPTYKI